MKTAELVAITDPRVPPLLPRRDRNLSKLPPVCFTRHAVSGRTVMLVRGEPGYSTERYDAPPEVLNAQLDPRPTRAQISAMEVGSMFGWDSAGADPDHPTNAIPYDPSAGLPDPHGQPGEAQP